MVEKANHFAAHRWWRTLPDDVTVERAQTSLDEFCERRADLRQRRHALAPAWAGVTIRDHGHVTALNQAAMAAFSDARPHRRNQLIPPGPAALAAAARLAGSDTDPVDDATVVDLVRCAQAAQGRNTLT